MDDRIELFLEDKNEYRSDLNNLFTFLQNEKSRKIDGVTLGGITTQEIIESIEYYAGNQFNKKSIALKYSYAVSEFFKYMIHNKYIKNKDFFDELNAPVIDEFSYRNLINNYISKNPLLEDTESHDEWESTEIVELIHNCDMFLKKLLSKKKELIRVIDKVSATLCIKLILYTGITYRRARNIKVEHLDLFGNCIKINDCTVVLPRNLSGDFKIYMNILNKLGLNAKGNTLFVNSKGKSWGAQTSSSKMPSLLISWHRKSDITGLVKFGAINLIKVGIGDTYIKKLTGIGDTILKDCYDSKLSTSIEISREDEWKKYINSKICQVNTYYLL